MKDIYVNTCPVFMSQKLHQAEQQTKHNTLQTHFKFEAKKKENTSVLPNFRKPLMCIGLTSWQSGMPNKQQELAAMLPPFEWAVQIYNEKRLETTFCQLQS